MIKPFIRGVPFFTIRSDNTSVTNYVVGKKKLHILPVHAD